MTMMPTAPQIQEAGLSILDCGLAEYGRILELQKTLHEFRRTGQSPDTVLVVEHPPVITLGARQNANRLLVSPADLAKMQIDLVSTRRGGGVTAHNPGQLIFYPILHLAARGLAVSQYIRKLEAVGINLLAELGVSSSRRDGFPGLWVGEKKIASVGVRVSRGVTHHGMAININNDLRIFDLFVPCGLEGVKMTSVKEQTRRRCPMPKVKKALARLLLNNFSAQMDTQC